MPTLYGKFVDGQFVADNDAKIHLYNKNASDTLAKGFAQSEAAKDIKDAISKLSQNGGEVKEKFSNAIIRNGLSPVHHSHFRWTGNH